MKNRLTAILIAGTILINLSLATGCRPTETTTQPEDTVTISLLLHGVQLQEDYKYRQEAMDNMNVKLYNDLGFKVNVVTTSYIDQFETMLSLDFAAGITYDMIRATSGIGATYMQKELLTDLTPYLANEGKDIAAVVPKSALAENTYQGKLFGIPTCSFPVMYGMWFRGDWLTQLGNAMPTNLSELESLMQKMLDDPAINKGGSAIPMAGSRDFFEMVFLGMFTEHPGDYIDESGKVVPKYLDPGYRTFTDKVAEWYRKGYINDLLLNGNENAINELISKDKVGIHVGNVFQLEYTPLKSYNEQKNLNMSWSLPFASDTKSYYSSGAGNDIVIFPSVSEVTDYAIKYYNWFYNNKENSDLVLYGIKDKTYTESSDSVSGKPYIQIPAAETSDLVKQPSDLIGYLGTNVYSILQLFYTNPTRPTESAKAYDSCNSPEIFSNYNLDVTRYFMSDFPGTLGTKYSDAKNMLIKRVSEMMVNKRPSTDVEWKAMDEEFARLGGQEAYDWLTGEYNKVKANLDFLKQP